MQFDMFGDASVPTVLESSPPVFLPSGAWIPPETVAFNAALSNGALDEAIAILKPLAVPVLSSVLLASGFSVPKSQNRRALMFLLQSDIVEAAQRRMTGRELLDARRSEKMRQVQPGELVGFDPADYSPAFYSDVALGDFITDTDGFNYVVDSLNDRFIHPEKTIRAIRPLERSHGNADLNFAPSINNTRSPRFTLDEAKLAKKRYEVGQENAVKHNSPALATSSGYSDFIRENSELSEGQLIRFSDSIYEIDHLRGELPYSEVLIKRPGAVGNGFQDIEKISLSPGEARAARRVFFPNVVSFDLALAQSQLAGVFGDVATLGAPVNMGVAGNMKPGAIVVDSDGKQYAAFSARFGYLEVHPIGGNGKPVIFAGSSIFFHVDPATASAYPERRHDPVFLVNEVALDNSNELMHSAVIDDAAIAAKKEEIENDAGIDGSGDLRGGVSAEDRGDGVGGDFGGESLDAGVAQSGRGAADAGDVSGLSGVPGGRGEGRFGERDGHESLVAPGNPAITRDQRSTSIGGVNSALNSSSSPLATQQELNSLLVTDMSDTQLLQAKAVFAGSRRSESIERQIQKRGLDQATGALASVAVDADKKTVQLPTVVSEAIEADMHAQKTRYMRLQSASKQQGTTLEQRLVLQDKAQSASVALRNMRLSIFAAEDAAALAIEAEQAHLFHAHAGLFPKAFASISAHVVSLGAAVAVAPGGNVAGWDDLSVSVKTDILKLAGWVTQADKLNFVGKRLLNEAWADIHEVTKATLTRNMVSVGLEVGAGGVAAPGGVDGVSASPIFSAASAREFRDPDTLNALVNPILDGDWFKLGDADWQARNGYSGRGWSLVKDRALHPEVRNLDSQVDFMRSVIEVSQLARAVPSVPAVAGEVKSVAVPVAFVAAVPAASVDRDNDVQLLAAARLLSKLTNGRNDIWMLAGRDSVQQRVQVMAALLGREKVTQAEAGVTAMRSEFYQRAGINTNTSPRGAENEFQDWVEGVVKSGPVASVSVNSLAGGMPTQVASMGDGGNKDAEQIAEAVAYADRLGVIGAERKETILSDLGFAWGMTADEVLDVAGVKAALLAKPNEKAVGASQSVVYANNPETYLGHKIYMGSMGSGFNVRDIKPNGKDFGSFSVGPVATKEDARAVVDSRVPGKSSPEKSARESALFNAMLRGGKVVGGELHMANAHKSILKLNLEDVALLRNWLPQEKTHAKTSQNVLEVSGEVDGNVSSLASVAEGRKLLDDGFSDVSVATQWGAASFDSRKKILKAARYTDIDQARAFSGAEWEDLPPPVRSALTGLVRTGDAFEPVPVVVAPDIVLPGFLSAKLQEAHRALGRGVTQKQVVAMRDRLLEEIESGTTNNGGVLASLRPAAIEKRRAALARLDQDLALFSQASENVLASVVDSASVVGAPESALSNDFDAGLARADDLEFNGASANSVWVRLSVEAKAEVLKQSGFVNTQGDLSFVGTRLASESWEKVSIHSKARDGLAAYIAGKSEPLALSGAELNSVNGVGSVAVAAAVAEAAAVDPLASLAPGAQAAGFAVPDSVRVQIQWALGQMNDVRGALEGVERARGDGAILAIEWADQSPKLVRPREVLDQFKEAALKNGVDANGFLQSLGGIPDFNRFEARSGVTAQVPGVVQSVAAVKRSEYPFGQTDVEDRFHGSRVRVMPELLGDVAWEGEVSSVFNGGRLVIVRREIDGGRDYLPVRIAGHRLEVLEIKDSQPALEGGVGEAGRVLASVELVDLEKDPHIGRTWNTRRGKATITSLPFPKREESSLSAMYEFTTEDGATFRVYEDKIDEQIKRDEHQASPQGLAETAAQNLEFEKAAALRDEASVRIAEEKALDDAKLAPFFSFADYSALKKGQAKKALLAPVRFEGSIVRSYEFAEKLAGRSLAMEIVMEDRIKPISRRAFNQADQREQDAHEERIKNAGKKQVHYIGGVAVGAFEFAYAGFVKGRLDLEGAAAPVSELFAGGSVQGEGPLASLDGGWSAQTHVLIAADTIAKLRPDDVHRLFEELPQEADKFDDLRGYIVENRPDLLSSVVDAIDEVGMPARAVVNSVTAEQRADGIAVQHAKAAAVQAFLASGQTVRLATQTKVMEFNSPDQIKLSSDGVYVAEGRDKNSSDGVRWVFLFGNQVDQLAAQAGALDVGAGAVKEIGGDVAPDGLDAAAGAIQSVAAQGDEAALLDGSEQVALADYAITEEDRIGQGGLGEKYRDNVRAIQIVRTLDAEKRHAVGEEKRALARYVGWGGLKGVFNPDNKQWSRQHSELRGLLSDAEWNAASRSQLDAHYTSPIVVNSMYSALSRLGFDQGRVLEPSVGVGNFFGMMPESMRNSSDLHGVELDILTSQIVSALYPSAKISKATGFQDYNVPAGYFDVVIGNPPFGSQAVSDDKGSAFSGWSIHNYFFAKSIQMLRPGGIMPMVVSHNFLDKLDPHVRQWIARRAELVSGVRLPNTAFKENANTEVVTDILIFKRLDYEHSLGKQDAPDWLDTTDAPLENKKTGDVEKLAINNYFLNNPQNVLGENSAMGSMYRANDYTVLPNGDLETQLAQWVGSLPQNIYVPFVRSVADLEMAAVEVPEFVKEGSFYLQGAEVWQRLPDFSGKQRAVQWEAPNQRALERMTGMVEIRDALRSQMKMERSAQGVSEEMIEDGRKTLNRLYDKFKKVNGFLNDPINRRIFLDDTESALIQALEFDYEKAITASKAEEFGIEPRPATAVKADIFKNRVLFPPGEIEVVETAKDALLHSLNYTGGVDMDYMQNAYGKDSVQIVEELGDLLFVDPVDGFVTADHYLSGDVKTKLAEVTKAAEGDVSLARNVEALKSIIPADKMPSEIHAAIGAAWIPDSVFNEFSREISGGDASFNYVAATGQWLGRPVNSPDEVKNTVDFGTQRMGSLQILNLLMNSRAPEIKEKIDGQYVTDQPATEAARQKADKIKAHWDSWVWSDFERAEKLASIYNDKFNRTVERKYDGSHLTLPGMSPMIKLLAHQKNGVWRGLQDRTILLDQVVGAGKTYEGIAMLMEMRRLGISKKPLIAVPNHLTLQWRSDFYKLYPGANVLAATPQDFEKDNRERFFSKVVTGNWDAVIVGHSSLTKIPVPLAAERKIVKEQFDDISEAIEKMKTERGDRNAIRDMEVIKENLKAKIDKLKEKGGKKDNVVDFEDLGVDTLFVDEMHEFKNLFFTTQMNRVAGLGNPAGSGKAFDMFVKIRWLRETYGQDAPLITATGTPVSNSLAEMFTMQRYMQYDQLKENNLHVFDAWAKHYGDVQTVYEVAPSGNGYRLSQRFAKFKNLGSLMGQYRSFADVVTLDDLKAQEIARGNTFPVPNLVGDKPLNVVAKRSELQEKFFGTPEIRRNDKGEIVFQIELGAPVKIVAAEGGKFGMARSYINQEGVEAFQRFGKDYETAEEAAYALALGSVTPVMDLDKNSIVGQFDNLAQLVKETKGKVNALSLTSLANKAGLDYRLIDAGAVDFPDSKVNQAIDRIIDIGKQWEADKGAQLIFCDLSVPLSAKAKMANKEKRVYVRDVKGDLTHRMGTLHTLKGNEGIAYFVAAEGKGKGKTFTIYNSFTGQLMKEGMDSKVEAHAFMKTVGSEERGVVRWLSLQETNRAIGADEIDEYKNANDIDTDENTVDQEITLHDVEGTSGITGFSIYDDMKAKLIAKGVPPVQIEFIHDHDTPQAKALLFKRVNDGDVRYLFGSTPKMGAGTNVQQRLVGLHHIDAPWRPSDLEQREGRIIRRGNLLYERDPVGFEIVVNRYATAQTYDTRRWQLLEHKAAGVEQLRKYTGANEIDDVASEAANSADMKAAASGNPLILKETQLSTELKKLVLLERAHRDGEYILNSKARSERHFADSTGPKTLEKWTLAKSKVDEAKELAIYKEKPLLTKEEVLVAMNSIARHLQAASVFQEITYKGVNFGFQQDHHKNHTLMKTPVGDSFIVDVFSPAGSVVRMNNWLDSIDRVIASTEKQISHSASVADDLEKSLGKPFEKADLLVATIEEHGKVQRALMKSNAVAAVKPDEAEAFQAAVDAQKAKLRAYGLGAAVDELENVDEVEVGEAAAPGVLDRVVAPVADMELYIKVAAESISELRKTDVYRVLVESDRVVHQADIAAYIKQERPDLVGEVEAVMQAALLERAQGGAVQGQGEGLLASVAPAVGVSEVGSVVPGIEALKTRMVDALSVEVPDGWIVMNAPRPLLGQKTMEGNFVTGRHYATLDPADSMTDVYIKENVKLDARLLVVVPKEMQMDVALHGNEYRDKYMEVEAGKRYEMLAPALAKLRDMPYGELSKAVFEAKGGVAEGLHSGKVLSVVAGVVSQKVDRVGTPVHHAASKLSMAVKVGDVVDIHYSGGVGVVSGLGMGVNVCR